MNAPVLRATVRSLQYWKSSDPCRFFLREMGIDTDTIQKLHNGGIRTFGQLETVTHDTLIALDITRDIDITDIRCARYFWLDRPAKCVLL